MSSDDANDGDLLIVQEDGKVGIGDATPDVALDVIGDIHYTGVITDVSDIRLKKNILPLQSPLTKLTSLEGFSFQMKNDPKNQIE